MMVTRLLMAIYIYGKVAKLLLNISLLLAVVVVVAVLLILTKVVAVAQADI